MTLRWSPRPNQGRSGVSSTSLSRAIPRTSSSSNAELRARRRGRIFCSIGIAGLPKQQLGRDLVSSHPTRLGICCGHDSTSRRLIPAVILLVAAFGCSKDENRSPSTPSCTVVAGAISASTFGAAGGTGSVPITAGSGCAWTATSSAAFVTISAGASGTVNGTISFTVAANPGAARTATLAVAGTTSFTISQSAAVNAPPAAGLSAPTAASPIGDPTVATTRPTLVVNNAAATGAVGPVTYRFEVSDQPGFPNDTARTVVIDSVSPAASTTSATVTRDLGTDTVHYWHARAQPTER